MRSLAVDANNLIAGTGPSGLILPFARGAGLRAVQTPKREITTVAVAADGIVYPAGTGTKLRRPLRPLRTSDGRRGCRSNDGGAAARARPQ
jgi:hypothetical protein